MSTDQTDKTTARRRPSRAQDAVSRATSQTFEPMEQEMGGEGVMTLEGQDEEEVTALDDSEIAVETVVDDEKVQMLAFMNDRLDIFIHDAGEPYAADSFEVSVNNRPHYFQRNQAYENVPRYIVEGLARARPTHYANQEYEEDGVKGVRYPQRRGLRYPFSVTRDPHRRGPDWLKHVLREP